MAAKYIPLPTRDDTEPQHSTIDFGSYFSYEPRDQNKYPKYFSYISDKKYNSIFSYERKDKEFDMGSIETVSPGAFMRCCATFITFVSYAMIFVTFPASMWVCLKKVQEYERIVVYRLGRLLAVKGPGHMLVLPCIDEWSRVDIRTRAFSIPPVKILTADSGAIEVGGEVYFSVKDAVLSVGAVQDLNYSTRALAQTILQRHLGAMHLSEIQSEKAIVTGHFMDELNVAVKKWGIGISKVELSDIKVIAEPNPMLATLPGGGPNPMAMLSSLLLPPGSSGTHAPPTIVPTMMMPGLSAPAGGGKQPPTAISNSPTITARELIHKVSPYLGPHLVQEFGTIYKFVVKGDLGGVFYLDLKHGDGSVGEGDPPHGDVDVTLTLNQSDLEALFQGQVNAFNAYMGGRLQVDGDLRAANNLQQLIEKMRS